MVVNDILLICSWALSLLFAFTLGYGSGCQAVLKRQQDMVKAVADGLKGFIKVEKKQAEQAREVKYDA